MLNFNCLPNLKLRENTVNPSLGSLIYVKTRCDLGKLSRDLVDIPESLGSPNIQSQILDRCVQITCAVKGWKIRPQVIAALEHMYFMRRSVLQLKAL